MYNLLFVSCRSSDVENNVVDFLNDFIRSFLARWMFRGISFHSSWIEKPDLLTYQKFNASCSSIVSRFCLLGDDGHSLLLFCESHLVFVSAVVHSCCASLLEYRQVDSLESGPMAVLGQSRCTSQLE